MVEKLQEKSKLKIIFIVSSTAQAEMFASIMAELRHCIILALNIEKYNKRAEIEDTLQKLGFPCQTASDCSTSGIKKFFKEENPNIVVFGHDRNPLDTLFIQCANSMNIPTLLIQDGIMAAKRDKILETGGIGMSLKYWLTLPFRAFRFMVRNNHSWKGKLETAVFELNYGKRGKVGIYGHGKCTKMAVFGDAVKRMFVSEYINPERVIVTGNPKFDNVLNSRNEIVKEKVYKKWGIFQNENIILLLTQYLVEAGVWRPEQRKEFVLSIAKAAEELPNTRLIIKLHPPHENEEDYQEIVKELYPQPIICKYASLPELYNACSLAVTVSSTAALEAMVLGKPVMIVNLYGNSGSNFYKNSGAIFAEKKEDILPAMKKALYDFPTQQEMKKTMKKFVFDQAYIQDGKASERIANLIRTMVVDKNSAK